MSSWGLMYYPLCGFDCGQVLNKRHARELTVLRNKVRKIQGLGLAISPRLSLFLLNFLEGDVFLARVAGACL